MLRRACLVLAVIGALSNAQEPRRCCFDRQFSAELRIIGGSATAHPHEINPIQGGHSTFVYDGNTERMAFLSRFTLPEHTTEHTTYRLVDYPNGVEYSLVDNETCTTHDLPNHSRTFHNCIPDNATYLGSTTYGYGVQTMTLDSWQTSHALPNGKVMNAIVSVTDSCVPVIRSVVDNFDGNDRVQTFFVSNYHPVIMYPVEIPHQCVTPTGPAVGRR